MRAAAVALLTCLLALPATGCSGGSSPATGGSTGTVLRADQTTVTGTVTTAVALGVAPAPLGLPLTVTIPNRGQGEANIVGVQVDGQTGTVSWDGGQPLPLSGTGSIELGQAQVTADADGLGWLLDGAPRTLTPGRYTAGSSVGIGHAGLARPVDQATFVVPAGATAQLVSVGGAQVRLSRRAIALDGPGRVDLVGTLTVHTARATTAAHRITLAAGPFELSLTPVAGGYDVRALLQGPVTTG